MYNAMQNKTYTKPKPGEEIVISGISGRYPESRNILKLKDNLFNKANLITSNYNRWKLDHPEIPKAGGKVSDISKFDAVFFGVHFKQAHSLDPMCRMLLEHSYEAILDAGINPQELRGSNTGVVIGACISESEKTWFYEKLQTKGFGITGCSRAMLANRISYCLDLHGPSYSIDTACSSSFYALDHGFRMIQSGQCDKVLIGGSNLCLQPYVTLQFARLGVLSRDCCCKSFDSRGNGYVRSEAICVILLQKAETAKRIYSTLCYTSSNCDGYKEQGITFPASEIQRRLFEDFYKDCGIPKTCLSYLEAHGTGTAVGDPEELKAINKVFCEGRTTPLRIGSVKSNIGHSEPTSGLCSITKVIIGMECGLIPPNMHFESPLKGVECLDKGRVQVITEPTPWEGGYVGVNSFGFGGANAHVLLKSNPKDKINNGAPNDDLPRLVVISGRTNEAVTSLLNSVENESVDVEYVRLLHDIFFISTPNHMYRGYTIVGNKTTENSLRKIQDYSGVKRPIWFVFSGMGSQWPGMGTALMRLPVFAKAIEKCDAVLKPRGVDIVDIITNKDKKIFDYNINSFVGIAAVQIGLVDLLTSLEIVPDNIIGHSVGELGCAYADGCFTAEEMILSAYFRGLATMETEMIRGSMAAIGLGYDQMKNLCPPDIEVACHNGPDSCTISGPADSMKKFVADLEANKIFAKEVQCNNIAYHSRYIASAGVKLMTYLKKIIAKPTPRSTKWLSTSIPSKEWSTPAAKFSSAEYHTNNLLKPVLFAETAALIPKDAVTIEIAPHGLLQAILKRSLDPAVINVALTQRGHKDNVEFCLQSVGKLYNIGLQPKLANIYPEVQFPVSRGTQMISPFIKWDHKNDWFVSVYSRRTKMTTGERTFDIDVANDDEYSYLVHHKIDGRNLIPAAGYLHMVWETLSFIQNIEQNELNIVFENLKFQRATNIAKNSMITLTIMIQKGSGKFEVLEGTSIVVTGTIRATTNAAQERVPDELIKVNDLPENLMGKDIYKELSLRGYEYSSIFLGLTRASIDGSKAHVAWHKNWSAFIDCILQFHALNSDSRSLFVPTGISKVVIDSKLHHTMMKEMPEDKQEFPLYHNKLWGLFRCGGVEVRGISASAISRRKNTDIPVLEEYKFVANRDRAETSLRDMFTYSAHLALENHPVFKPKIIELVTDDDDIKADQLLTPTIVEVMSGLPMISPTVTLAINSTLHQNLSLPSNSTRMEPDKIPEDGTIFIAVGYELFTKKKKDTLEQLSFALRDEGFLLTRETKVNDDTLQLIHQCGFNVILEKACNTKILLLLKKKDKLLTKMKVVHVNNYEFDWLEKLQKILRDEDESLSSESMKLIIVAEDDMESGALGFYKCLQREFSSDMIRVVIIQDKKAPKFCLKNSFYTEQLNLDIAINVLRPNNVWGTYRHLPLAPRQAVPVKHAYAFQATRGDLNSLEWVEGPLGLDPDKKNLVHIEYSSLNFRDVMITSGKLPIEAVTSNRLLQDSLFGFEYSGVTDTGRRVMGMIVRRGISNMCEGDLKQWDVPDDWTLEDAATIPVAYITSYVALHKIGRMKKTDKILIHLGSGGLGQAAINMALHEGCEVFTTVGTPAKRKFIRETFPSIDDDHIGNSRDTSFEQLVFSQTNGEGVDIIVNSLSEEKLLASFRCLSHGGRFVEVGKFDMAADNSIGLKGFLKETSFHAVLLDHMFFLGPGEIDDLCKELELALKSKAIKPITRTCFTKNEVPAAIRHMAAGKHIGKVLIKMREEGQPLGAPILAIPRFNALPKKNYVIVGGLGGLGLELADWLIVRGARFLTFVSRTGPKTGYQQMKIDLWKSYGVNIATISGVDASKADGCEHVLKTAEKQAPVDGIFNLAALLRDNFFINQTRKSFEESLKPKMLITKNLDEISRKVCPRLRYFVAFSSISCGRGNAGQTNYGMGNSVMERICERRVEEGLPGLAIQWGPVGSVGLAAEMTQDDKEIVVGGTKAQRISSCFEVLDVFLTQNRPVVSSMVVAAQNGSHKEAKTVLDAVMNIMGLKDLQGISPTSSLPDIGMDSMMGVELKQCFERDFELFLSPQDIRSLNISKVIEMSERISIKNETRTTKSRKNQDQLVGLNYLMKAFNSDILHSQICVNLSTLSEERKSPIFLIPGIEGCASIFSEMALKLKCPAISLQLPLATLKLSVEEIAETLLPHLLEKVKGHRNPTIFGYSFGSLVAIDLVRRLEAAGFVCNLILVDGAPDFMKEIINKFFPSNTQKFENKLIVNLMNMVGVTATPEFLADLEKVDSWSNKMDMYISHVPSKVFEMIKVTEKKLVLTTLYNRLMSIKSYDCSTLPPIKANITLIKPTKVTLRFAVPDYGLNRVTLGRVEIYDVEGNHLTMLENNKIVSLIHGESIEDEKTYNQSLHEKNAGIDL